MEMLYSILHALPGVLRAILEDAPKFVIPLMLVAIPVYGLFRRVPVYEEFVTGAKEGFQVAVRIIPYLVAILFAIGMFRASGAMTYLIEALRPVLGPIAVPPEIIPMAITRPLSGRVIAMGRISGGMAKGERIGRNPVMRKSIAPLARNIPIANRIATRYGMIRTATEKPSLAPSTKLS